MWDFALKKLKKDVGYKKLSCFLKDLGLKQRTVFNEEDETHMARRPCFWLAENFEDSKLHDTKLFMKYKATKGAWLHMNETQFAMLNLEESMDEFEEQMNSNFKTWNMEFKETSLI